MRELTVIIVSIVLFISQWLLIVGAYLTNLYQTVVFRALFADIASWPLPSPLPALFMLVWAALPIVLIAVMVNKLWLHLPMKLFWLIQLSFVLSIWLALIINLWIAKL